MGVLSEGPAHPPGQSQLKKECQRPAGLGFSCCLPPIPHLQSAGQPLPFFGSGGLDLVATGQLVCQVKALPRPAAFSQASFLPGKAKARLTLRLHLSTPARWRKGSVESEEQRQAYGQAVSEALAGRRPGEPLPHGAGPSGDGSQHNLWSREGLAFLVPW